LNSQQYARNSNHSYESAWISFSQQKINSLNVSAWQVVDEGKVYPLNAAYKALFKEQCNTLTRSLIIIPKDFELYKVWWLNRMELFYFDDDGFVLAGESRLHPKDLNKISMSGKTPFDYPWLISGEANGTGLSAKLFKRNGNHMQKPLPHTSSSGGHVCLGNYADDLEDALQKGNHIKVASVLIEYTSRFNPTDPYGRDYHVFMDQAPAVCFKCGLSFPIQSLRTNARNRKPYCYSCFYTGTCMCCGNVTNVSDDMLTDVCHRCTDQLRDYNIDWATAVCKSCGEQDRTKLHPWIYEGNQVAFLCEDCSHMRHFEKRNRLSRLSREYIRRW